jgi:hypothetical protein
MRWTAPTPSPQFFDRFSALSPQLVDDLSAWPAEGDESEELAVLRRNVDKGLPCGSESFIELPS